MGQQSKNSSPSYKELWQSLNPAQQEFVRKKVIVGNYTPDKWLKLLNKVAELDKIGDKKSSNFGFKKLAPLGILPLSVFMLVIYWSTDDKIWAILAGVIGGISILLSLIFLFKQRKQIPDDLHNSLRKSVIPIIHILREDMAQDQKLRLSIRADYPLNDTYLTKQEPKPDWNIFMPRTINYYYVYPWMQGKATLKDGSVLKWLIKSDIHFMDIAKRSRRSGKWKYMEKYKFKHQIRIKFSLPKTVYASVKSSPEIGISDDEQFWHLSMKKKIGPIKVKHRSVLSSQQDLHNTMEKRWVDPFQFADMLSSAYNICNKQSS